MGEPGIVARRDRVTDHTAWNTVKALDLSAHEHGVRDFEVEPALHRVDLHHKERRTNTTFDLGTSGNHRCIQLPDSALLAAALERGDDRQTYNWTRWKVNDSRHRIAHGQSLSVLLPSECRQHLSREQSHTGRIGKVCEAQQEVRDTDVNPGLQLCHDHFRRTD